MSNDHQEQGGIPGSGWQSAGPAAGWYQDPWDARRRRYWDGAQWTGDVSFEPPHNWGGQTEVTEPAGAGDPYRPPAPTPARPDRAPAHPGWAPQAPAQPQWPGATREYPAQAGWGGWGQPPQHPGAWGMTPMWQSPRPVHHNRVHVAVVAIIAAIAVLAGIGIGSQLNATSASTAAGSGGSGPAGGGTGGLTSPFGGGAGAGTAGGSSALSGAQRALVQRVDRSVVDINTQLSYQNGAAAGTGMVLTSDGTVLTNNHVIDGATSISVTLVTTGKTYKASVVGTDVTEDVAVLQMQGASGLTPIDLGTSANVSRGDSVVAIGNAGGAGGAPSAVTGTVRALDQTITASDSNGSNSEVLNGLIQTDAPIQAGDSGGPLVNSRGQVIGMDTAASSSNQVGAASVGFAIPISSADTIATQIQQGKASDKIHIGQTGFLGVSVQDSGSASGSGVPGSLGSGQAPGGSTVAGASVANVIPNSPADKAGITQGDTITGVNGTSIGSATALTASLRRHHPGDQVSVTWVDTNGASHTATVTLAVGPAA